MTRLWLFVADISTVSRGAARGDQDAERAARRQQAGLAARRLVRGVFDSFRFRSIIRLFLFCLFGHERAMILD
jgi:hypothetical protein